MCSLFCLELLICLANENDIFRHKTAIKIQKHGTPQLCWSLELAYLTLYNHPTYCIAGTVITVTIILLIIHKTLHFTWPYVPLTEAAAVVGESYEVG